MEPGCPQPGFFMLFAPPLQRTIIIELSSMFSNGYMASEK